MGASYIKHLRDSLFTTAQPMAGAMFGKQPPSLSTSGTQIANRRPDRKYRSKKQVPRPQVANMFSILAAN